MTKSRLVSTSNNNLFINNNLLVGDSTSNVSINSTSVYISSSGNSVFINSSSIAIRNIVSNNSAGSTNNAFYSNGTNTSWSTGPTANTALKNFLFTNSISSVLITPNTSGAININVTGAATLTTNSTAFSIIDNTVTYQPLSNITVQDNNNTTQFSLTPTGPNTFSIKASSSISVANVGNKMVLYAGSSSGVQPSLNIRNLAHIVFPNINLTVSSVSGASDYYTFLVRGWVHYNSLSYTSSYNWAFYIKFLDIWYYKGFYNPTTNSSVTYVPTWTLLTSNASNFFNGVGMPGPSYISTSQVGVEFFSNYDYAGDINIAPGSPVSTTPYPGVVYNIPPTSASGYQSSSYQQNVLQSSYTLFGYDIGNSFYMSLGSFSPFSNSYLFTNLT